MGDPEVMGENGSAKRPLRRALPWIVGALTVQAILRAGGWLAARRLDTGDEQSPEIRRVAAFGQLVLAPVAAQKSHVHLDLMFAGADLDLTGVKPGPGGTDVDVHCAFGGGNIRVPADWRVAWDSRGIGGVGIGRKEPVKKTDDPDAADLRIHLRALFGGVGLRA